MTKEELISELIDGGYLKTPTIIEAFKKIARADFVPEDFKNEAYGNYPLPIGSSQTISQPLTVAFMLELLQPKPGEKILDIGAGSGWQTTILAYIVSQSLINADKKRIYADKKKSASIGRNQHESALVIAIERIPKLKTMTEVNVSKYNFVKKGIVRAVLGDGSRGFSEEAPFDKIIAAAASGSVPTAWKKQLKAGGRIVAPVRGSVFVVDKISEKEFKDKEYSGFAFVPLVSD